MFMGRKILLCITTALLFTIAACGSKEKIEETVEKETSDSQAEKSIANGDHISLELTEDVIIDADVVIPEEGLETVEVCQARACGYDGSKLMEKMIPNVDKEAIEIAEGYSFEPEFSYRYEGELGLYDSAVGTWRVGLEIDLSTEHWDKCRKYFPLYSMGYGLTSHGLALDEDFAFATKEEAITMAEEYLVDTVGLEKVNFLRLYAINHSHMQTVQESMYADPTWETAGKPEKITLDSWDENDDCYWMKFEMVFHGLPVLSNQISRQELSFQPLGTVEVGYTKAGIEYVYISEGYEVITSEKAQLVPIEDVFAALRRKYEMAITGKITIDEMKLIYFPQLLADNYDNKNYEFDMIPTWQFSFKQGEYTQYVYVNALDGTEVVF